jgi:isocitrate dehydrogenase
MAASLSNPYESLAAAQRALREIGRHDEASALARAAFACKSTEEMASVIARYLDDARSEEDAGFARLLEDVMGSRPTSPLNPITPIDH